MGAVLHSVKRLFEEEAIASNTSNLGVPNVYISCQAVKRKELTVL